MVYLIPSRDVGLISLSRLLRRRRRGVARAILNAVSWGLVILCFHPAQAFGLAGTDPRMIPTQAQVISLGILLFQDESGTNAPPELGRFISQDLRQKLLAATKDVLPKVLETQAGDSAAGTMNVDQMTEVGKRYGVKFVLRGGLLALTENSEGNDTRITAQLYAEVISVDSSSINTVRAEGNALQRGPHASGNQWASFTGNQFRDSGLGQALSNSVQQMALLVQQAITNPQTPLTIGQPQPPTDAAQSQVGADAAQAEATKSAEADDELQQLITQAEALMYSGRGKSLDSLSSALEKLKAALSLKATLLAESKNSATADAEVMLHRQEVQQAVAAITEEVSSADAQSVQAPPSDEKKSVLARIGENLGEVLTIVQRIQEIRASFHNNGQGSQDYATPPPDSDQPTGPVEEQTAEVTGVVTDSGNPVEGVAVSEPKSGASATTDIHGSFTLAGLVSNRVSKVVLTRGGRQVGLGQVNVVRGRTAVADFELRPNSSGISQPTRVTPSTVVVSASAARERGVATVKGEVLDPQGRPVPRALINLKGMGAARTDSQGRFAFVNVPVNTYQLTIQSTGLKTKTEQVRVEPNKTAALKIAFASADTSGPVPSRESLILRGQGSLLRGRVLDHAGQSLAGARITVVGSATSVSVASGSSGNFEFRDVKAGQYRVLISKTGYEEVGQTVSLRAGETEQRSFQLMQKLASSSPARASSSPARASITPAGAKQTQLGGRVFDPNTGRPIPEATVAVQGRGRVETDGGGNYIFTDLVPGTYEVVVAKAGFSGHRGTVSIEPGKSTRRDFPLAPNADVHARPGQLRGLVTDARTGKPIAGAIVAVAGYASIQTNQAGAFASDLRPGVYRVLIRKDGYFDGEGGVTVRAGEPMVANFRLNARTLRPIGPPAITIPPQRPRPSRPSKSN